MSDEIKILFLGDIVGRPGRYSVKYFLQNIEDFLGYRPDFIIANCENASHGFGLTEKNYNELIDLGINVLTSGNHIWDRKEIFNYIDRAEYLLRPLNYPAGTQGKGSIISYQSSYSVAVISLLGRIFMEPYDSPWEIVKAEVLKLQSQTPIIIVDFHAEATAEKVAFGYYLSELGVTAILGTHTHVQTADEKLLNNSTAYISDVGFCGAACSVIGMDVTSSVKRLATVLPIRYEIPSIEIGMINGVIISVDKNSGIPNEITRINNTIDLNTLIKENKLSL